MELYVSATKKTYDLNNPAELVRFRQDLVQAGFFHYPENKQFYGMFTRSAKKEEIERLINSIKFFELRQGAKPPLSD